MSLGAWMGAFEYFVKDELGVLPKARDYVGIYMAPGMPPPLCPQLFAAIYPHGWHARGVVGESRLLEETYEVGICLTRKTGHIPTGYLEEIAWGDPTLGLEALGRKLICRLLRDMYEVLREANKRIPGAGSIVNGSLEPMVFSHVEGPTDVGAEWFADRGQGNDKPHGMVLHLIFTGGKRVQDVTGAS